MKRKLLTGVGILLFGISGMAYADDTTVTLDGKTSSSGFSIKDSSGTSIARFQGDGKVGIGTTNPETKLHVLDGSDGTIAVGTAARGRIRWDNSDQGSFILENNFIKGSPNTIKFRAAPTSGSVTDIMTITGDGNVGIGTTKPASKLDVAGGSVFRGGEESANTITLGPDDVNVGMQLTSGTSNGTPYIDFANDATSDFDIRIILLGDDTLAIQGGSLSYTSDVRLKKNVTILEGAVEKIRGIRGVSFEWKDEKRGKGTQIGLIAQEVEKVIPELVHTDNEGYKSVSYEKLTAVLVEAIKEQQKQNKNMKEQIVQQQKQIDELKAMVNNAIRLASVK